MTIPFEINGRKSSSQTSTLTLHADDRNESSSESGLRKAHLHSNWVLNAAALQTHQNCT